MYCSGDNAYGINNVERHKLPTIAVMQTPPELFLCNNFQQLFNPMKVIKL